MTSESKEDEKRKRTQIIHRFIQKYKTLLGITVAISLGTTVYYMPPDSTTVSCTDPTIRQTYHPNTISVNTLLTIAWVLPIFVITLVEWCLPPAGSTLEKKPLFKQSFFKGKSYSGDLILGGGGMFLLNDIAKIFTSKARPSFWDICAPILTEEQCQQPSVQISWEDCENPMNLSQRKLADSFKSFPSGHASMSTFSAICMIVYFQQRVRKNGHPMVAACLQILWASWAYLCSHSRILDNMHHPGDVLGGVVLGATGALISLHYISNWFIREEDLPVRDRGVKDRASD